MFTFIASKKVYKTACNYYKNLWKSCEKIEFERCGFYNNYCRLEGHINGTHYQVHINSAFVSGLCSQPLKTYRDNSCELSRVFAVACACSDLGYNYNIFSHLAKELVLNA